MGKEKIEELLKEIKGKDGEAYNKVIDILSFLNAERIKLVGNGLRQAVGRSTKNIDMSKIQNGVKELNEMAKQYGVALTIPEDMDGIEKYLRYTILEDVQKEFNSQN